MSNDSKLAAHTPLVVVREMVRLNRRTGTQCPACDQRVQVYRRPLNSGQAHALVKMYQHHRACGFGAPFDTHALISDGKRADADFGKCRHFGLIRRVCGADGKKRSSRYLMTDLGRRFVEGRASVPEAVFIFNDQVEGRSDAHTTIQKAAGNRFDYERLMGPYLTDQLSLFGGGNDDG